MIIHVRSACRHTCIHFYGIGIPMRIRITCTDTYIYPHIPMNHVQLYSPHRHNMNYDIYDHTYIRKRVATEAFQQSLDPHIAANQARSLSTSSNAQMLALAKCHTAELSIVAKTDAAELCLEQLTGVVQKYLKAQWCGCRQTVLVML